MVLISDEQVPKDRLWILIHRGHFLVDAALNTLLVCNTFNISLPVDTRVDDAVQTTDEPTGTVENATEPDEPTSTEEQQENATKPRPSDMD